MNMQILISRLADRMTIIANDIIPVQTGIHTYIPTKVGIQHK